MTSVDTDVLVVGSGPSGSATALRLASLGHRVTLVEKRATPRHKACGDVLTPRAVAELPASASTHSIPETVTSPGIGSRVSG